MASGVTNWYRLTDKFNEPVGLSVPWTCPLVGGSDPDCGGLPYTYCTAQFLGATLEDPAVRFTDQLFRVIPSSTVISDIPSGATVVGVEVEVYKNARQTSGIPTLVQDHNIVLMEVASDNSILNVGTNQALAGSWVFGTNAALSTYGSDSSLMGLASVNPAVHKYAFGIEASCPAPYHVSGTYAYVKCVRYRFWYNVECNITCDGWLTASNNPLAAHITTIEAGNTVYYWGARGEAPECGTGSWTDTWSIGVGSPISSQSTQYTFTNPGTYDWNYAVEFSGTGGTATCNRAGSLIVTAGACVLNCSSSADTQAGEEPLTVNFTGTYGTESGVCGVSGYTFDWDFGDGNSDSGQNPSHVYSNAGSYSATFTVTDNETGNVCSATPLAIVVTPGGSTTCTMACSVMPSVSTGNAPLSVTFTPTITATNCVGSPTYDWDFGDGDTSTDFAPTHVYDAGTWNWSFTVTRDGETCTDSGSITVNPGSGGGNPVVNITNPSNGSTLSTNSFTATWVGSGGTPPLRYTYQLDSLAPVQTNSTSAYLSGVSDGSHTFTVTAIDSLNLSSAPDSVSFTISGGGVSSFTVNFTATSGADSYQWNFGDGQTASGTSNTISHTYTAGGIYTATVTAVFGDCPAAVDTVVVDLSNFTTDFSFSPNLLDVTFTPTSAGGISPTSPRYYLFDFGDNGTDGYYYLAAGTGSTAPSFHHIFPSTGSYDVGLVTFEGGDVDSFTATPAQTVFNSSQNFVAGTAVVLLGADDDSLELLTVNTHYTENIVGGEGTGITLVSPASSGDRVHIGYIVINTPAYSFSAVASHIVNITDAGELNVSLNKSSGTYCYSPNGTIGDYDFTATVANGTPPYTFTWLVDQDCEFDGTDSTGYTLKINNVISNCATPIVHSGVSGSSDSVNNVSYNPPAGSIGVNKTTHVNVSVTDSTPGTPLTGSTTITLQFYPLPTADAAGPNNYAGDDYRFQSLRTTTTTPAIGGLYLIETQPRLGIPAQSGVSYSWAPSTYLDSPTSAQPRASLPYTPTNVIEQLYTVTATKSTSPNCVNVDSVTVIKPTVNIQSATDDVTWPGGETCYRRVALYVSAFNPLDDGLAIVVERIKGPAGSVSVLGSTSASLPNILDRGAYGPCDTHYLIGSYLGGICLLDPQHRNLNGGTNRIAMKMSPAQSVPFTLYVLDPICSDTSQVTHDYRIRVVDISGSIDSDVTEAAIVSQTDGGGLPLYSVSISNDVTVTFGHANVNTCTASLIINPPSTAYTVVGAPWSKQIPLTAVANGFTPTSWTWQFDKLGQFGTSPYSYSVTNNSTATPTVTYSNSSTSSVATKVGRVGLSCQGTPAGGGAPITVIASDVDYTINYSEACNITCDSSITTDVTSGTAPLTVNFAMGAVTSNCSSPDVTYSWVFGDGGTGAGASVSHTYTSPGTYTATVTASSSSNPSVTCTKSVVITATGTCSFSSCTATVNGSTSTTVTAGQSISLGGTAAISGTDCGPFSSATWDWTCPGAVQPNTRTGVASIVGSSATMPATSITAGSTPGTYTWNLTWSLSNGQTCSRDVTVIISAGCTCSISILTPGVTPPAQAWVGDVVPFSATVSSQNCSGAQTWTWNFGDGYSGSGFSTSHTYAAAGTYNWNVTVSYDGVPKCQTSGTIQICDLTCNITNNPTSPVAGSAVTFYSNATAGGCSTTGMTYAWDFGDSGTSTQQNPSHTYASSGSYTVTLTITLSGHSKVCTKTLQVSNCVTSCSWGTAVISPLDNTWFQIETDTISAIQYSANTSSNQPCTGTWSYGWAFPCGSGSTSGASVTHNYTGCTGIQTVTMDQKFNGTSTCSSKPTGTVRLVSFTCNPTVGPTTVQPGGSVSFNGAYIISPVYTVTPVTYNWNFGDSTSSTSQSVSHTYNTAGTYNWSLTINSAPQGATNKVLSCTSSGTITVAGITFDNILFDSEDECLPLGEKCFYWWDVSWSYGTPPFTVVAYNQFSPGGLKTATHTGVTERTTRFGTIADFGFATLCGSFSGSIYVVITDSLGASVTSPSYSWSHPAANPC